MCDEEKKEPPKDGSIQYRFKLEKITDCLHGVEQDQNILLMLRTFNARFPVREELDRFVALIDSYKAEQVG
jgi:hypothetical protein